MLLYQGNCSSGSSVSPGEVLAQNNSYTNFSFADIPESRFVPHKSCPPAPPPPPPPPAGPPWTPATDCEPACPAGASCCKNPASGQDKGACFGYPSHPITNCSQIPAVDARLRGEASSA